MTIYDYYYFIFLKFLIFPGFTRYLNLPVNFPSLPTCRALMNSIEYGHICRALFKVSFYFYVGRGTRESKSERKETKKIEKQKEVIFFPGGTLE